MSEAPITQDEMRELFGETMPIEAVKLLWEAPDEMTAGEARAKLRQMAQDKQPKSDRKGALDELTKFGQLWDALDKKDTEIKRLEAEKDAARAGLFTMQKERQTALVQRNEAAQERDQALAENSRLREALLDVDALDPEAGPSGNGFSPSALAGLISRMGEIARQALQGEKT